MANQNPKFEHLKQYRFPGCDRELGKVIGTRFPLEVEAVLLEMGSSNRQNYIRKMVEAGLIADGLLKSVTLSDLDTE
jgi:hypothetical protein